MLAAVTPRSAARAKSGRTIISGRTKEALELTLPTPLKLRSSRSTARAVADKATASSLRNTSCILTPVSILPTLNRAPGMLAILSRNCISMSPKDSLRSSRCVVDRVNTARRASADAPGANASPLEPPPIELNTCFTPLTCIAATRARSAT